MKKLAALALAAAVLAPAAVASAATTRVPGHQRDALDQDGNGISDAGVVVNGRYTDTWGPCSLTVTYRGDFGNTPYQDTGWMQNHYVCKDGGTTSTYHYLIVHETDPRYTGNPEWAVWGTWEYHVLTQGGQGNEPFGGNGNLVRPYAG